MKNIVILAALLPFAPVFALAQGVPPAWYMDKEMVYPSGRYITGIGEGASRADAEGSAVAAVSMFFNTKTEVRNEMLREFNEAVSGKDTSFSKKTYITEGAVIRSEEELLGIRFAAPWHNERRGQWAALAYIDRQEAASMYESRIAVNMTAIEGLAADAKRESELLYACALLNRAVRLGSLTEELIRGATLANASAAAASSPRLVLIASVRSEYRAIRGKLSFEVRVAGGDVNGRIARKLASLLEENGYTVTDSGGLYTLTARISNEEETLPAGVFVMTGITVRIGKDSAPLFSYSKSYDRYGHRTLSGAMSRAVAAIEQDLETNFMERFTATIGR